MLSFLKRIFRFFDAAAKRYETKCIHCGHVMQGVPQTCEKCGMEQIGSRQ